MKLCCPEMAEAKINEAAGKAQRAILEHFLEPIARKKFKRNLTTERVNTGSTETVDSSSE